MRKKAAASMPTPAVAVTREPNLPKRPGPPLPEPLKPSSPKQPSPAALSGRQKVDRLVIRLQQIKAAGLMDKYKPISNIFDTGMKEARTKYTESRLPVSKKNEQLLSNKPKRAKVTGTELEQTRYRDYQKQAAECARLFISLKTELTTTTEALEKNRDDAIDRLLAIGAPSKTHEVLPGSSGSSGSSAGNSSAAPSAPTPQPFRYTPVAPVTLPISLPKRPAMPQGSLGVPPLPGLRQVKQEVIDVDRIIPVAAKDVTHAAAVPEQKLPAGPPNKVLRKAAGECILRSVIHVLSRCFAYISRGLFKSLYYRTYGKDIGNYSRFIQKPWKKFLDCTTNKRGTFYRLNPAFFLALAERVKLPRLATTNATVFFEISNMSTLPPITPMGHVLIKSLVTELDLSLANLYTTDRELLPRNLPANVPLQDFQKYLFIWNKATPSPTREAGSEPLPLPKKLKIGDVTPEIYDQYIEAAITTPGMQAKRTKKVLAAYSTKMTRPIEEQRQALLDSSLGMSSITGEAEKTDDSDMSDISSQSDGQTQHLQGAHLGVLPKRKRVEDDGYQELNLASDYSDGGTPPPKDAHDNQDISGASDFLDGGSQQSGAAHSDQDMSDASEYSDGAVQKPGDVQQGTCVPQRAVYDRPSTTTTPTRFAPYPSRNTISAQKQGEGALLTASARKSDKEKATTVGAIRSQKDFFKRPVLSGGVQSPSVNKSFSLPRPNLPEDPNRRPLPTWESQVRRSRFSCMSRHQLHEARKEAREFLIDWMWSLPLRHGSDYPDKVQM